MGAQSIYVKNIESIIHESTKYLQDFAEEDFMEKYFLRKKCQSKTEKGKKYHYLILSTLDPKECDIVDYINKKISGELENEYRKRKALQNLNRVEFEWECEDMYDSKDTECCEWKSIEW